MTTPAPLDLAFFKQLRQLGDDVFLSVVVRRAVRGDREAVANALEAISEGGRQEMLWARPKKVSIPMLDAKGLTSDGVLEQMSLLEALALSLSRNTLSPETQFNWVHLSSIESDRRSDAAERTNQWEWRDDRRALLGRAIELCAEQSRLLDSKGADHPIGLLFDALVHRVDYKAALKQFLDEAPVATTFTIDIVSGEGIASLVRRGNLYGASLALDMIPLESKQLNQLLQWLHTDADKGSAIFEGLLNAAHGARKDEPNHVGLLEQEAVVVDLLRKLIDRDLPHAGDILLRVCTGSLQISQAHRTPPCTVLIEALLEEHERRHEIEAGQAWQFEPPPESPTAIGFSDRHEKPRGITESQHVSSLMDLSIAQCCAPIVERLRGHLVRYGDAASYSAAWAKLQPEVPVDTDQFRRTTMCLFEAGVPKGAIDLPANNRGKRQISSALHLVAQSGHPQTVDLMICLLNLGCDPLVPDNQRRKPGSYLDDQPRKRWDDVARSVRAREAAVDALREEFGVSKSRP